MGSPLSDRAGLTSSNDLYPLILSQFQGDLAERLNVEQMFILIDGVLPFEACLYHQVLPLFLEGSRLHLGLVCPDDISATDYVRRITSYHNYSLVPHSISAEALKNTLSAYLNYSGNKEAGAQQSSPPRTRTHRSIRARSSQPVDPHIQQTLVVDSPEELGNIGFGSADAKTKLPVSGDSSLPTGMLESVLPEGANLALRSDTLQQSNQPPAQINADSLPVAAPESGNESPSETKVQASTVLPLSTAPAQSQPEEAASNCQATASQGEINHPVVVTPDELADDGVTPQTPPSTPPVIFSAPQPASPAASIQPALEIEPRYLNRPMEFLLSLPPHELLQELLGRALVGGIGRLYFERQEQYGRVLCSQNGVLRAVLDRIESSTFQGLVNELKRMTQLPMLAIEKSRQIEIERFYQQTRLLLRFQFIPTDDGEAATLQILRGAALKFYQQQQLASLERDALSIAKQLQGKMNEICDRARSSGKDAKLEALSALGNLIQSIEAQIESLKEETNP
jgi:hypothetical protein